MILPAAADIVEFWRAAERHWFAKDDGFDATLRARFEGAHHAAARGELGTWEAAPESSLALLLLLDQAPRNIFRGSAHAFATDPLAQGAASRALDAGFDRRIDAKLQLFFYLPLEHAEDTGLQARSVALFEATGIEDYVRFARLHRDIIARFGRFPHRNAALGRISTLEETEFLAAGGFKD